MTSRPHRQIALRLLTECETWPHKEAGFLGHVCVAVQLTEKQAAWLARLEARHASSWLAMAGEAR